METTERNRENGKKGGQGDRARERMAILEGLVRGKDYMKFLTSTDDGRLKMVRQKAREHDKIQFEHNQPLHFTTKGNLLSSAWFKEWIVQFLLGITEVDKTE